MSIALGILGIAFLMLIAFFTGVFLGHEIGSAKPPANENEQDQG